MICLIDITTVLMMEVALMNVFNDKPVILPFNTWFRLGLVLYHVIGVFLYLYFTFFLFMQV